MKPLLLLLTEPDRMRMCILEKRAGHSRSGQMSDARLPGVFPHLPVRDLCLQPGRSHGPDAVCHHPNQVRRIYTRGRVRCLWTCVFVHRI